MDSYLIDYLRSGKAWVLVGSGPSNEMGYPSWEKLARKAIEIVKTERRGHNNANLLLASQQKDYPRVFEEAKQILGGPRLLECLREGFKAARLGRIYELIARWPVPIYLTTNFDNEIHSHLVNIGEAYNEYFNSADHLASFVPDFSGAILKLHGDLRSENGLVLTTSQYREIEHGSDWKYWRTKLTSIFQMNRVVIIGHSLTDKHIKHVLEAAKQGSGVVQPVCWIAPDVARETVKEYLEQYRIRVITYDNRDGSHRNLVRLIESISEFIPPRISIQVQQDIAQISRSPLGSNAAAPGFFVFSKLAAQDDIDGKRIEILIAALQSILPQLRSIGNFTLDSALALLGWPIHEMPPSEILKQQIQEQTLAQRLFVQSGSDFKVSEQAENAARENYQRFTHLQERFRTSVFLRIKRDYPNIDDVDAMQIASDIEAALTGYFRVGGLSLATILLTNRRLSTINAAPNSIIKFITEASAQYDSLLKRQAFWTTSVATFVRAEAAEREYLGRISQGFFSFHALGLFGDSAIEKVKHATDTVWLVDSNVQILALALPAPTSPL